MTMDGWMDGNDDKAAIIINISHHYHQQSIIRNVICQAPVLNTKTSYQSFLYWILEFSERNIIIMLNTVNIVSRADADVNSERAFHLLQCESRLLHPPPSIRYKIDPNPT